MLCNIYKINYTTKNKYASLYRYGVDFDGVEVYFDMLTPPRPTP